jgi:hypothetical protein
MRKSTMYAMDAENEEIGGMVVNGLENHVTWNAIYHKCFYLESSASNSIGDCLEPLTG